ASFTCLEYTNGLGENSSGRVQSQLARLWMLGYLAGYQNANGNLQLTDDQAEGEAVINLMLQTCREYPQSSLLGVSLQALAPVPNKIPNAPTMEFTPAGYTCGDHVDAKGGTASDANKADLADLWAFAFIQGYKNVSQPNMQIPIENKPALTGAIAKNCTNNREMAFMDLTALVSKAVKLE
ncbi:MAG: hypothetical protein RLN70_10960, partial [Rhodospirillaceae bacterium]